MDTVVATGAIEAPGAAPVVDEGYPRRLLITVLLAIVGFSASMTIVSASLPELARALGTTESTMSWAVTGLFLTMAVGTPVMGKLGDLYGHRRVFLAGSALLSVATVGCGVSWDAASFIGFRMVVGLGIGATMPSGMALVMEAYPIDQRSRAMGWFQMAMTGAPVLGLVIGGPMIEAFGWRTVFAVLAPISAVGLVGAWRVVRDDGRRQQVTIDWGGAATLGLSILSFLLGLEGVKSQGPLAPLPLALFLVAAALLVAFGRIEGQHPAPLLPLRYLRRRNFTGPLLSQALGQFAYMGGFLVTPIFLSQVFGLSVGAIAFILLFRPGASTIASPIGGRLTGVLGPRTVIIVGSALMVLSMLSFAASAVVDQLAVVVLGLVLSGLAMGFASPAYVTTIAGAVDRADLGVANGTSATTMNIGVLTGIQAMFVLLGDSPSTGRFGAVFLFGAAVAAIGIVGGLAVREDAPAA